jgi:transmembrane sensor
VLGPLSSIRYTAAPRGPRTVHLSGHALFTVTHDSARLFAVHTAHGTATDLGTQFVVRSYPGDSAVVVAVVEGEVSLRPGADTLSARPAADSLLLRPGDRGRATAAGTLAVERGVDVDRYLAWSEGRLEFRNAPMRDVIAELGRWYDLEIRLANGAIAGRRLTASFNDESIDEVLGLIRASLDVRTARAGRVVTIGSP